MIYNLYGALTKLGEHGELTICEPIFVRDFKNNNKKFYKKMNGDFKEISIKEYEKIPMPTPVPTEKKNNRKVCLITFEACYNKTSRGKFRGKVTPSIRSLDSDDCFWLPSEITVGIKFPNAFICVPKDKVSAEELQTYVPMRL